MFFENEVLKYSQAFLNLEFVAQNDKNKLGLKFELSKPLSKTSLILFGHKIKGSESGQKTF